MSEKTKLPKYAIVEHNGGYSILKLHSVGIKDYYNVHMPDLGSLNNARFVFKAIQEHEEKLINEHKRREEEFQSRLKNPHVFIMEGRDCSICYCGKEESDEIHISEEEEVEGGFESDV